MRILTDSEIVDNFDKIKIPDQSYMAFKYMYQNCKIESDFSGNIFYSISKDGYSHSKPLNIQIKELAAVPVEGD